MNKPWSEGCLRAKTIMNLLKICPFGYVTCALTSVGYMPRNWVSGLYGCLVLEKV